MQDDSRISGPRVIVTRPEPDAAAFAAMLTAAGFAPILSPAMEIRFEDGPPELAGVGAVVFTSANGVRAYARLAKGRALPAFAVGAATAAEAKTQGLAVAGEAEGDLESLAALVKAAAARGAFKGAVLHIAGSARAGDLLAALQGAGVPARRAVLYEARGAPALSREAARALRAAAGDLWVALFSPRTARLFLDQARRAGLEPCLQNAGALCLSDAVAEAANAAKWAAIATAPARSGEAMIETLRTAGS